MKLGKVHYLGSCLDNQGKMVDFYARKIGVLKYYMLPTSIIVVNGLRKPVLHLVDIPSNLCNYHWNNDICFHEFVRTNIWAFSNSIQMLSTKQHLMSCCEANNMERVSLGLHEIKYNLKFWILCDSEGNVYDSWRMNILRSKLHSTKPRKASTLSSYSECLPLP